MMMKAIVYTSYGQPEVLSLQEVPKPTPKDNEVLIQVHAASVNSWDWDLLRGVPYLVRLGGLRGPRYPILGADVAGRIVSVGKEIKQLRAGDEVFGDISGCNWGGFAEYVCARETALSIKPDGMSFEEAAALPQAAVLALQGLRKGELREGHKVLINGAGGGVGTFALQIAKSYGAEVTAVDHGSKLELLRSLGADKVIDYTKEDFTHNRHRRYDLILDVAGFRSMFDYKRALAPTGIYVMIGGSTPRILQLIIVGAWAKRTGNKKMNLLLHKPSRDDQDTIGKLYETGQIKPVIDRKYLLSQTADALKRLGEGNAKGKLIIQVMGK
ncbi:NAD(P)-dependent alcohol dehydrogenase [Paenibacillus lignilyticus]